MKNRDRRRFEKLRVEFLPEALEIVEQPTAPLGSFIIWLVFSVLVVFVLWACLGVVDEVAVARGQIVSTSGAQEIQAAGSGIITEVKVKEGDTVQKGDLLYSLDKEVEKLNIDYSEGEIGLMELKVELLTRLLDGKEIETYRNGNYTADQMEVIESIILLSESDELSLTEYEKEVESAKNQYEVAKETVQNNKDKEDYLNEQKILQEEAQEIESTSNIELELLKSKYKYAEEEEEKYKKLYDAGAKSKAEWQAKSQEVENIKKQIEIKETQIQSEIISEQSDNSTMDYQINENAADYSNKKSTLEEMKINYDKAQLNLANAKKKRDSALYEQREQYLNNLKEYGVTVKEQYYEYENKDIYAPYDGVIKTLNVEKEGAVVSATQVVAEILPTDAQLLIDAEVSNQDIGFIEVGQSVDVKVDTYDYQKYGILSGSIVYISPDAIENEQMEQVYKVTVLLDVESENKLELAQGMQCSVEIKTDRRRIIEFFLEPLTEAFNNSLRER